MSFYFAWVTPDSTAFLDAYRREDEKIFGFTLSQDEGDFAALDLDIQNPHVGLLSVARDVWAWLAYDDGHTVTPMFFGRLLGTPSDLQADVVRLSFIAKPQDWDAQKSALAETLRVAPTYDPVWINPDKRLVADTVLEARPDLWHVDRVSHVVSISNINVGEDGTLDLGGDFFYDSLSMAPQSSPVRRVTCRGEVAWSQAASGDVDLASTLIEAFKKAGTSEPYMISTYTGGGLASDWPKQGTSIGSGWTVGLSFVTRADGTIVSENTQEVTLKDASIGAFPIWRFLPTFHVSYAASRQRNEIVSFTIEADVQPLLTDPGLDEALNLSLSSQDVDQPIDAFVWADLWQANTVYESGAIVAHLGNLYLATTGGTSASSGGPTGTLSSITDNSVIWAWQGLDEPIDLQLYAPPWTNATDYVEGDLVINNRLIFLCIGAGTSADASPTADPWLANTLYAFGAFVSNGGNIYRCLSGGTSAASGGPSGTFTPETDNEVLWAYVQASGPAGSDLRIYDGSVIWTPQVAGLPIGDPGRKSYFLSDRGKRSIDYLIALCRAQLQARARAVNIAVECSFDLGLAATLRKNAAISDARLPGGTAAGKIISYTLSADGDTGELKASLTLGCTIGNGNSLVSAAGTPDYVVTGYVDDGYETVSGRTLAPFSSDVTYDDYSATPVADDGVDFAAMRPAAVVRSCSVIDGIAAQQAVLDAGWQSIEDAGNALNQVATMVDLVLVPLQTGPYLTEFDLTVSDMMVPKTLDLEAA